jgi:hypothetical protein
VDGKARLGAARRRTSRKLCNFALKRAAPLVVAPANVEKSTTTRPGVSMSRRHTVRALLLTSLTAAVVAVPNTPAAGHLSGCHRWHSCPSDQATYRWRQPDTGLRLLCVKPTSDKRNSSFNRRTRWAGFTYYCKR